MGIEDLTSTPWHIERMHRQDGDKRRHRSNCKYYNKGNRRCEYRVSNCIGSAHCSYYEDISATDDKIEKHDKTIRVQKNKAATTSYIKNKNNSPVLPVSRPPKKISVCRGTMVDHKKYGIGIVTDLSKSTGCVKVHFLNKNLEFPFPSAFTNGFLKIRE